MIGDKESYTEINSRTWDEWAKSGCDWSLPISHEEYIRAKKSGICEVYLTPCRFVPLEWFGISKAVPNSLSGKKLLGLASGGGQQMPIFAALGADCTVFDYSDAQLERERRVSQREGYDISIVKGDMTHPLPFGDASFDIIFHPVSNCYIKDVYHVWNECARLLKPGGRLLAGLDNGFNFLFEDDGESPLVLANKLPFDPLTMPEEKFAAMRDNLEAIQFSHSLEEQLGGQLKAGLHLLDLYEDRDREGSGRLREYAPQYFATLAVK